MQTGKRLDIQGLRAIAVLVILLFHAKAPLPGGFVGVDVFFVISGFVITQMLMRERARFGRIDLRHFYVRRFRRLTPALALTVSAVVIAASVLESPFGPQQTTAATAVGTMLLVSNIVIAVTTGDYFDAPAAQNPLLNMWSLSVEEQFYLVFPALLIAAWLLARRFGRGWVPIAVVGVAAAASFALAVATAGQSLDWPANAVAGFYGAAGRAWEFAFGALLALATWRRVMTSRAAAEVLAWLGAGILALSLFALSESTPYPGWWTLLPVLASVALIASGATPTSMSRLLSLRPMVFVGDISYSWYLWHWPMVVFALIIWPSRPILAPVLAVTASVIPAYASYRWVEMPIRGASNLSGRRLGTLVVACLAVPMALAGLLYVGASNTWWIRWPTAYVYQDSASYVHGCHDTDPGQPSCRWGTGENGTVLLVGDSQALSLSDGLIAADSSLGLATETTSASQCPFILPGRVRYSYENETCTAWQEKALDYALRSHPDVVVIANRPYVNGMTGGVTLLDADGIVPDSSADSVAAWDEALGGVVSRLRAAGIEVVLAEAVPEASYDMPPSGLIHIGRERSTRQQALDQRRAAFAADETVAAENPGTVLYDPLPELCNTATCPDAMDGAYLYADPRHLSVAGSLKLAPSLASTIKTVMPE